MQYDSIPEAITACENTFNDLYADREEINQLCHTYNLDQRSITTFIRLQKESKETYESIIEYLRELSYYLNP